MAREALELAGLLDHGYSRATAAYYAALTFAGCGDLDDLERSAQQLSTLCDEHGMELLETEGRLFRGRARWERGDPEALAQMQEALDALEESGDLGFIFVYACWVAEALQARRDPASLRALIERMFCHASLGQGLFLPEMYRWRGELALLEGDVSAASGDFSAAHALALTQGSVALALRARISSFRAGLCRPDVLRLDLLCVEAGGATGDTRACHQWIAAGIAQS